MAQPQLIQSALESGSHNAIGVDQEGGIWRRAYSTRPERGGAYRLETHALRVPAELIRDGAEGAAVSAVQSRPCRHFSHDSSETLERSR